MAADGPTHGDIPNSENDVLEEARRITAEIEQRRRVRDAAAKVSRDEAARRARIEAEAHAAEVPHSTIDETAASMAVGGAGAAPDRGPAQGPTGYRCPWCGREVEMEPSDSRPTCRACGGRCALGRCPRCHHVALNRIERDQVICSVCSRTSDAGTGGADRLIETSNAAIKAGCALTALVWILIPLGLMLLLGIWALIGRR